MQLQKFIRYLNEKYKYTLFYFNFSCICLRNVNFHVINN